MSEWVVTLRVRLPDVAQDGSPILAEAVHDLAKDMIEDCMLDSPEVLAAGITTTYAIGKTE